MTLRVDIAHAYPGLALEVAFDAPPGVTALFGPSGAGKTTVAHAVAGLLRPDRGLVRLGDTVLTDTARRLHVPPHRRRIGCVFQDARLFPHRTVRGNLAYGQRRADAAAFDRIVALLDLAPLLPRGIAGLSGGEAARVAIGRALLSDPRLLVMDEPLASLDASRRMEILPCLERLRDEAGTPILYVSHAVDEVARLATTLVMIDRGRVRRAGPAEALFADPALMPLFGPRGGALIAGTVAGHHPDGLTEVRAAGGTLWLPALAAAPGAAIRLRIPAQDVILARTRPEGLSALNVLAATVTGVLADDAGVTVALAAGGPTILARITARSAAALALTPGTACFAILKSVALAQGGPD